MRSESCTFIWQPNVSIRYLGAIFPTNRLLSPFAFAFRPARRRLGPTGLACPLLQHLTSGPPKSVGNRFAAEHSRQLLHATGRIESPDNGGRATALDAFVNQ